MSIFSNWSFTATTTVWFPVRDDFGQAVSWTRTQFSCSFTAGGRQMRDDLGEEFAPTTTVYLESAVADAPIPGCMLVLEASEDSSPPATAETVRRVLRHDPSTFGEGLPDFEVFTE